MHPIDLGEAALRGAPRCIRQAVVLLVAAGLLLNAGWAAHLMGAIVTHRADAAVRQVQDTLRGTPLAPPSLPVREG